MKFLPLSIAGRVRNRISFHYDCNNSFKSLFFVCKMPIDFNFRSVEPGNLDAAMQFIASQDLGYPNYGRWTEKTRSELSSGIKRGILAYSNGVVVGDVISQKHKELPNILELKNIRIHPKLRGRNFASFMLRQTELETSSEAVIVDARADQKDMIDFLTSQGYFPIAAISLYDSHNKDMVMVKPRNPKTRNQITSSVKSYFNCCN